MDVTPKKTILACVGRTENRLESDLEGIGLGASLATTGSRHLVVFIHLEGRSHVLTLLSTMHRADYQRVLVEEARRLGADIRLGCDVIDIQCGKQSPVVKLASGETITGDVIVGADGLRSLVRTHVLGYVKHPEESGDLAYRITIPRQLLEQEQDPFIQRVINEKVNAIWWGNNSHVVMYGVRGDKVINLVLVCVRSSKHGMIVISTDVGQMPRRSSGRSLEADGRS